MVTVQPLQTTLFCTISICGLPFLNNVAFPLFRLQEMGSLLWCQGVMESGKQTNFLQWEHDIFIEIEDSIFVYTPPPYVDSKAYSNIRGLFSKYSS